MMTKLKKLLKNNLFVFIIIAGLIYFAPAIYLPSQANEKAIVTAIGIDKEENNYSVSALIVIPTAEKTDSANGVELINSTGVTLGDALNKMSLDVGKAIGLAHCDALVISDDVLNDDLRSTLDYLNRSGELTKNAMLFNSKQKAKDVLEAAVASKIVPALKLSTMIEYNKEHTISKDASLDAFYTEYYTPSSISMIPIIDTKENEGSSNSQSDNGSGKINKILNCNGDICVLKTGKKVATLSADNLSCYNALKRNIKTGYIKLQNVNGEGYKNADIMLEIRKKNINKICKFEDGRPLIKYKGNLLLKVVEINNENNDLNSLSEVETKINETVKIKLMEDIKNCLQYSRELATNNNVDLFEYDNLFSAYESDKWSGFKEVYSEPKDYMPHVDVIIDVQIDGKF